AGRRVLDHRVHLRDEPPGLQLDGVLVHCGCQLGAPALQEAAARAAQSGEKPSRAPLRRRIACAGARDTAHAVLELSDAARRRAEAGEKALLLRRRGRRWRRHRFRDRPCGVGRRFGLLRAERSGGYAEQHGQAAHQVVLYVVGRSQGYNVTMTLPATSRQTRTFDDRADALAHFFLRAGEAPRLLAYEDAAGCPLDQALAALEWTAAVGILAADDLIHAARLAADAVPRARRRRPLHAAARRLVGDGGGGSPIRARPAGRTLQLPRSRHRYLTGSARADATRPPAAIKIRSRSGRPRRISVRR